VPVEVEKTVVQYVKNSGADFAVITNPANPMKAVDLKEVTKLPATTDITLNQYNVFAYKKILRDIIIYPSFNGITPSGVSEVDIGVSRKITNNGVYLGAAGGYDFRSRKIKDNVLVNISGGYISDEELSIYLEWVQAKQKYKIIKADIVVDGEYVNVNCIFDPVHFERIRRITGYLVGSTNRWYDSKRAEEKDKVKHG